MTMKFCAGDVPPVDVLEVAEKQLMQAAEALARTIDRIEAGDFGDTKDATNAVRDVKSAFYTTIEVRGHAEKLRKHATGIVGTVTLDLHAARDEIGRRLACLRDAGAS